MNAYQLELFLRLGDSETSCASIMSTVLLMTDSWQPTVLRLVPFSHNNAKNGEKKRRGRENGTRSYPVLAVTRPGKTGRTVHSKTPESMPTSCPSAGSSRSEHLTEPDTARSEVSVATVPGSVYTNFTCSTSKTDDHSANRDPTKRYQKKIVPKSHADLNEAITFPVQDLNEQITSSTSFKSLESAKETNKEKTNKLDNTRTKLPKPSMCPSPDVKMCSPINGVRRSVPLTPGELDLKRFRESYILEQAQKRKKYKLNVNQLPRSTTPINDHDPDKLNMKQVIAFLQTKATRDTHKKVKDANGHKYKQQRIAKSNTKECARISVRSTQTAQTNDSLPDRSQTSVSFADKNTPGRVSVLSTKSTPNFSSVKKSDVSSTSRKADRIRKPMKEFKLYRFLTLTPDGQSQGITTAVTDTMPPSETIYDAFTKPNTKQTEKKEFLKKSYRSTTTANLLHRRAARKTTITPPSSEEKENENNRTTAIRLPIMTHDHHNEEHDDVKNSSEEECEDDTDSCSTTSATCNSTKNSLCKEDRSKYPKKGKSVTLCEEPIEATSKYAHTEEKVVDLRDHESMQTLNPSFTTRMLVNPEFPRVNLGGPRQIKVNIPQETKNGYSQEIVRLTLRHEKNATRFTSYMSDMQTEKWPLRMEADTPGQYTSVKPLDSALHYSSHKDLYDSSKQIMNSVSNNHFIKVRQKLKSNLYDNDYT